MIQVRRFSVMETQTNHRIALRRLDMPLTPAVADAPLVASRHVGKRISLYAIEFAMTRLQITEEEAFRILRQTQELAWSLIKAGEDARLVFERHGHTPLLRLVNVLQFLALYGYDVSCPLEDILRTESEQRKKLYARYMALSLLEAAKTLRGLLGKEFQNELSTVGLPTDALTRARDAHRRFTRLFTEINGSLGEARNSVVAHKDASAQNQLNAIARVNVEEALRLGKAMTSCSADLTQVILEAFQACAIQLRPARREGGVTIGGSSTSEINCV
jgi:hypothetical protein